MNMFYDDKTRDVFAAGKSLIIYDVDEDEDVVFKASFIVASDIRCSGSVTALFDLIVMGNIECERLDVKGRLICLGNCNVEDSVIVQNTIWVNDLRASKVICHDMINAQGLDADNVKADGNIIVGKTLAVEDRAETFQNIICGETAYGAGKLVANMIVTAEELDMDDGEEALENPFVFRPENSSSGIMTELNKYVEDNDYQGFFNALLLARGEIEEGKIKRALSVFSVMNSSYPESISDFKDVALILWLIDIINTDYYMVWPQVREWLSAIIEHFDNLIHGRETSEKKPRPANTIDEGYVVNHAKYGRGVVSEIAHEGNNTYATVDFEEYGEKKFPIPDSLSFFRIVSERQGMSSSDIKNMLTCELEGYDEWLEALSILNSNKAMLGDDLYNAIYDMLLSKIGLKMKYIQDRLQEKGWN